MAIAIYARQSLEKVDSLSINGQVELCKKECDGDIKEYVDSGFSGKNIDRPSFQKMMSDIQNGEISKVVVYRLDRISRSITDFGSIWELFKKNNVEFVSVNEKFDTTTPMGRAMIYIIMVFAQLERETIAERIKDNYYQRAKSGAYLGGSPAYGFDISKTQINGKKASMLVPNDNMKYVKEIFEMYANTSKSLGAICRYLKKIGVPSTNRATWDNVSLSRILHNPTYAKANPSVYLYYKDKGVIIYNDIEEYNGVNGLTLFGKRDRGQNKYNNLNQYMLVISKHNGIIDSDIFLKCQKKLEQNVQIKNKGKGKHTWLSGLMKCDKCGYSIRVTSNSKYNTKYLVCSGKANFKICDAKNLKLKDIEEKVEKVIQNKIDLLDSAPVQSVKVDNKEIENKINIINEKISKLVDSLIYMDNSPATYINKKISELDNEKTKLTTQLVYKNVSAVNEFVGINFTSLDFEDKKIIAQKLIKSVLLSEGHIRIEWVKN